jgi:hypothetical protein
MEEQIETRVSPDLVWKVWERAHVNQGQKEIAAGQKGKNRFPYQVLDVKKGESFSILWKTLFVRLVFSHSVKPTSKGSLISYQVKIKGPFSWFVKWLLGKKIRQNVQLVLKSMVRELEGY